MDGLDGAFEPETEADLLEGQVGLLGDEDAQLTTVRIEDDGVATTARMKRSDVSCVAALGGGVF